MASQGGESRLAQMQMRFQQKQRQEREQRKMEMIATKLPQQELLNSTITVATNRLRTKTTATSGASSTITSTTKPTQSSLDSSLGAGKVRQMFNERRRGIDKSNPLKPINTVVVQPNKGRTKSEETRKTVITSSDLIRQAIRNGGSDLNLNENTLYEYPSKTNNPKSLDDETFPDDLDGFGLTTVKMSSTFISKKPDTNNNPRVGAPIKLKPVITKKAPPRKSPITPITKTTVKTPSPKTKPTKMSTTAPTPPPRASTPPEGTVECKTCKRYFNNDRIEKHTVICEKTASKKRKPFDATKHRVKGTDAEKYLTKKKPVSAAKSPKAAEPQPKKSNWRSKHEEFINAIRAAKEVQAHLAKGGKLSDLPPPPPSENPDYIQCPHCQRRFNEAAASRHIPKCANMLHNKPKPGAPAKRR